MAARRSSMPANLPQSTIVRRKVRLTGVIAEKSAGKQSSGTDFHCSVRIVDPSEYRNGLLINIFAGNMDNLPQIETVGDIITVSHVEIKEHNAKVNAVFPIYEGKYAQKDEPYHCSPKYHTYPKRG